MPKVNPSNQPTQYQRGWVEFYKLHFKVTPDVLIPRPETELLVDEVLNYCNLNPVPYTILDMGTGSGNIAISIAKNLSVHPQGVRLNIIATDVSGEALEIAKQNAKLHGVMDKIEFIQSNLLKGSRLRSNDISPDIIVTNLPYIPTARIPYLDSSVKDFEPHIALDGGENGFCLYEELFNQIIELDWNPKLIVGEIDYTHGDIALEISQKYFPHTEVSVKTDLSHKQRILIIGKNY